MRCIAPILLALAASSARALRDGNEEEATKVEEASSMTAVAWASRGQIAGMAAEARAHMAAGFPCKGTEKPTTGDWEKLWPNRFKHDPKPQCVGRGMFGTVFVAETECPNDFKVAVKEVNTKRTKSTELKVLGEARYMKKFDDCRVVRLYASSARNDRVYFVMEHLGGGALNIEVLQEKDKLRLFAEVLAGVVHIHSKNVAHLDLKPDNILLTSACTEEEECHAKITDFGHSCMPAESVGVCQYHPTTGSPGYIAPEALNKKPCLKSDLWSLGMILHEILHGNNKILECTEEKVQADKDNERVQSGRWDFGNSFANSFADFLVMHIGDWIFDGDIQSRSVWEINEECIKEFNYQAETGNQQQDYTLIH